MQESARECFIVFTVSPLVDSLVLSGFLAAADRKASSITGATFIREFVKNIPWAHLDIAGTAYLSAPRHYHSTPVTGVCIRLLIEFFSKLHD